MTGQQKQPTRAIVVGASMAALLAARVLSKHIDQVTILDRDRLDLDASHRRGVPQARHPHALLAGGLDVLEHLFPGFTAEVISDGGILGDLGQDTRIFMNGGWLARYDANLPMLFASRSLLESVTRRHVRGLANVAIHEDTTVDGLLGDSAAVTGVSVRGPDGAPTELAADLTVAATGRSPAAEGWLRALGSNPPGGEHIGVRLSYVTRAFRRDPTDLGGTPFMLIAATPPARRSGFMLAQENGTWLTTMSGVLGERAPEDLPGYLDYARSLPSPEIGDLLTSAEPVGDAAVWHFRDSRRLRYEKTGNLPRRFLVIGDGISSFNPQYGQGLAVAAQEAAILDALLDNENFAGNPDRLSSRYFTAAAAIIDIPWQLAAGADLRYPDVTGRRTLTTRIVNRYVNRLLVAAHRDPAVADPFYRVNNLLDAPTALFRPRVVRRVLTGGRGEQRRGTGTPAPTATPTV